MFDSYQYFPSDKVPEDVEKAYGADWQLRDPAQRVPPAYVTRGRHCSLHILTVRRRQTAGKTQGGEIWYHIYTWVFT